MFLIQLVAGLGYLVGHYLLSRKKTSGWLARILGGLGWVIFLYLNGNYIFMAVVIVIVLMMMYGFYKWHYGIWDVRTFVDRIFELLTVSVAVFMIVWFAAKGNYSASMLLETCIVIAEIAGTMLLARKYIVGWYAYIVMSVLVGILIMFVNPTPAILLGLLELASIYFFVEGIKGMRSNIAGSPPGI